MLRPPPGHLSRSFARSPLRPRRFTGAPHRAFAEKQLLRYYVPHYESYGAIFSRFFLLFSFWLIFACSRRGGGREGEEKRQKACDRRERYSSRANLDRPIANPLCYERDSHECGIYEHSMSGNGKVCYSFVAPVPITRLCTRVLFPYRPPLQNNRREYTSRTRLARFAKLYPY